MHPALLATLALVLAGCATDGDDATPPPPPPEPEEGSTAYVLSPIDAENQFPFVVSEDGHRWLVVSITLETPNLGQRVNVTARAPQAENWLSFETDGDALTTGSMEAFRSCPPSGEWNLLVRLVEGQGERGTVSWRATSDAPGTVFDADPCSVA